MVNKGETKPVTFLSAKADTMVDDMVAGELEGGFDQSSSGSGSVQDDDDDDDDDDESEG